MVGLEAILGPTLSHLISINLGVVIRGWLWVTKAAPITQEIPRVLGALCQELGFKIKYIFYYTTSRQP